MSSLQYFVALDNEEEQKAQVVEIHPAADEKLSKDVFVRQAIFQMGIMDPAIWTVQQVFSTEIVAGRVVVATVAEHRDVVRYVQSGYLSSPKREP